MEMEMGLVEGFCDGRQDGEEERECGVVWRTRRGRSGVVVVSRRSRSGRKVPIEGETRAEVAEGAGCSSWFDSHEKGGLSGLVRQSPAS